MVNATEPEKRNQTLILYSKSLGFKVKTQNNSIQNKM